MLVVIIIMIKFCQILIIFMKILYKIEDPFSNVDKISIYSRLPSDMQNFPFFIYFN